MPMARQKARQEAFIMRQYSAIMPGGTISKRYLAKAARDRDGEGTSDATMPMRERCSAMLAVTSQAASGWLVPW